MEKDLFEIIVDESKLNKNFSIVKNEVLGFSAARTLVNEIYNSLPPIDPDFIKQFQSTGFDARIWELYLTAVFQEFGFDLVRKHNRPDFELITQTEEAFFVEAVTSMPEYNEEIKSKLELINSIPEDQIMAYIADLREKSLIRIAGALRNKIKKEYWNLEWVKGHPLILAVEPFHHSMALSLSDSSLVGYLYGFENTWSYDEQNNLHIETIQATEHTDGKKTIPSNFFSLPNCENISAVLFSNSGTISKFNRMGKLKGFGDKRVIMMRIGGMYDHDPNASLPLSFKYIVGENGPDEYWRQGLAMYHNPNAIHPISRRNFPGILHGYFDNEFYAYVPNFHPYQSETHNFIPEE